ncbi:hypothetical protein ACHAAC_11910 [Aeromicrobium sp. CF4.19]|uniref:hypothetical protein n=1 Tax=Aeromicrobium sp. CF4.19 TaxID=3373082 RepID=UPI003EE6ADF6
MTAALWTMAAGAVAYVALQIYTGTRVGALREDLESQMRPSSQAPQVLGDRFLDAMMIGIVAMLAFFAVVVLSLWVWMIIVNARGLRWARITATCLAAYNAMSTMFTVGLWAVTVSVSDEAASELGTMATQDTTSAVLGVLQALIGLVAVGLLWLGPSGAYIRGVGAHRAWDRWQAAQHRT